MRYGYFMMPMHPPGSFLADTLDHDLRQIERLVFVGDGLEQRCFIAFFEHLR